MQKTLKFISIITFIIAIALLCYGIYCLIPILQNPEIVEIDIEEVVMQYVFGNKNALSEALSVYESRIMVSSLFIGAIAFFIYGVVFMWMSAVNRNLTNIKKESESSNVNDEIMKQNEELKKALAEANSINRQILQTLSDIKAESEKNVGKKPLEFLQ